MSNSIKAGRRTIDLIVIFLFFVISIILTFKIDEGESIFYFILEVGLIVYSIFSKLKLVFYIPRLLKIYMLFLLYRSIVAAISREFWPFIIIIYKEILMLIAMYFICKKISADRFFKVLRNFGVILSLLGVYEYVTKSSIFMHFINVDTRIIGLYSLGTDASRARTIFIHPIVCGVFTVLFWILIVQYPYTNKWFNIGSKIITIGCLIGTQARSSWIAFVVVNILLYAKHIKGIKNSLYIKKKQIMWSSISFIIILIAMYIFRDKLGELFTSVFTRWIKAFDTQDQSNYVRTTMMAWAYATFTSSGILRALFGHGTNYAVYYLESHPILGWKLAVDNQYITILIDTGIIGLIPLISFIIIVLIKTFKSKDRVMITSGFSLLAIFVSGFFYEFYSFISVDIIVSLLLVFFCDYGRRNSND